MKRGAVVLAGLAIMASGIPPALADVPIGNPPTSEAWQIALDVHHGTGHWFAVVRYPELGPPLIVEYMSTDGGRYWAQTYLHSFGAGPTDVDMVVAGDYFYVAWCIPGSGIAQLMRFDVSTGVLDSGYGQHIVVDVSPAEVVEIALASDQDGADNEIYYALIASDGNFRFFYDSSADGTTFEELSPPISDACCGLDMTFNPGSLDHDVFFSYFDTTNTPRIWRSYPWEEVWGGVPYLPDYKTAISAWGDTAIMCIGTNTVDGRSVSTWRSYDAGTGWSSSWVEPPDPGGGDYIGCDVTARGGQGFAISYVHEEGAFDPVYLRRHTGAPTDPWGERVVINETDVAALPIFRTTLNWFPPASFGVAYIEDSMGYPYFDRVDILPFDDGFESGDTLAWSGTVP